MWHPGASGNSSRHYENVPPVRNPLIIHFNTSRQRSCHLRASISSRGGLNLSKPRRSGSMTQCMAASWLQPTQTHNHTESQSQRHTTALQIWSPAWQDPRKTWATFQIHDEQHPTQNHIYQKYMEQLCGKLLRRETSKKLHFFVKQDQQTYL